jgi:integrase
VDGMSNRPVICSAPWNPTRSIMGLGASGRPLEAVNCWRLSMGETARWLDREAVAQYIRVKESALPRLVKAGRLPPPSYHLGPRQPRWDRLALDACFEGGIASTDPDVAVQALVQEILAEPRPAAADPDFRTVRKRLADGSVKEYRYPRRPIAKVPRYAPDSLDALLAAYRLSPEYAAKAKATRAQYAIYLRALDKIGHLKVSDLRRRQLMGVRDAIAKSRGNVAGTAFGRVASALLSWSVDRGWIEYNPLSRLKALKGGQLPPWSDQEIELSLAKLPEAYRRAVILALYTGQRRSDLIAMTWSAYDGRSIKLKQRKTGAELVIPTHGNLKFELDQWKLDRGSTRILTAPRGQPWTAEHLSREMAKELQRIGLPAGHNIHGLRKVAATRMAEAGCSAHKIAAITGHMSLSMVQHYTRKADQERLATAAIERLETSFRNSLETAL